ncbi:hypothetical protein [Nocardia carnea]|uniref:hypothetical protein n=1 Tax=Nocardia carnea TaxID=37328 RepID=UPI0024554B17|nr:hypothetical protein [Nocardia carnea]
MSHEELLMSVRNDPAGVVADMDRLHERIRELRARIAELESVNIDLRARLDLAVAAWHSERDSYRMLRDAAENGGIR